MGIKNLNGTTPSRANIPLVTSGVVFAEIRIENTVTEVKVGSESLERRHTIEMRNFSSDYIWWDFTDQVSIGGSKLLRSGSGVVISLNPEETIRIYAITDQGDIPLEVLEVR
jgi:hypothetical protein